MSEIKTAPAVLRMTVQVVRASTGKVETFEVIGTPVAEQTAHKEDEHVRDAPRSLP